MDVTRIIPTPIGGRLEGNRSLRDAAGGERAGGASQESEERDTVTLSGVRATPMQRSPLSDPREVAEKLREEMGRQPQFLLALQARKLDPQAGAALLA